MSEEKKDLAAQQAATELTPEEQEERLKGHHNWITDLYDKVKIPVKYMDITVIVLAIVIFVVLLTAGRK